MKREVGGNFWVPGACGGGGGGQLISPRVKLA